MYFKKQKIENLLELKKEIKKEIKVIKINVGF